jgi:hypothetical protein
MDVHPNSVFAFNNELNNFFQLNFFSNDRKKNKMNTSFHLQSNIYMYSLFWWYYFVAFYLVLFYPCKMFFPLINLHINNFSQNLDFFCLFVKGFWSSKMLPWLFNIFWVINRLLSTLFSFFFPFVNEFWSLVQCFQWFVNSLHSFSSHLVNSCRWFIINYI